MFVLSKGKNLMAKVTGIGGVFFKAKGDPKALADWYHKNLGMPLEAWGGTVLRCTDDMTQPGMGTAWKIHNSTSEDFKPSPTNFMVNYRIDNMDDMVAQLKANGVKIEKGPESHENGNFLWLLDPDQNQVVLWEPKVWDEKNKG